MSDGQNNAASADGGRAPKLQDCRHALGHCRSAYGEACNEVEVTSQPSADGGRATVGESDACEDGDHSWCLNRHCGCVCHSPGSRCRVQDCPGCGAGSSRMRPAEGLAATSGVPPPVAASAAPSPAALDNLVRKIMADDENQAPSPASLAEEVVRQYECGPFPDYCTGDEAGGRYRCWNHRPERALRVPFVSMRPAACCAEAARAMREAAAKAAETAFLTGVSEHRERYQAAGVVLARVIRALPIPGEEPIPNAVAQKALPCVSCGHKEWHGMGCPVKGCMCPLCGAESITGWPIHGEEGR